MTSPFHPPLNGQDAQVLAELAAQLEEPSDGIKRLVAAILRIDSPSVSDETWDRAAHRCGLGTTPRRPRP